MKSKILALTIFFLVMHYADACPIWPIGRMLIVDESGKPIPNAVVWKYWTPKDSFINDKSHYSRTLDTNIYVFWTGGGYYRSSKMANTFRIVAQG